MAAPGADDTSGVLLSPLTLPPRCLVGSTHLKGRPVPEKESSESLDLSDHLKKRPDQRGPPVLQARDPPGVFWGLLRVLKGALVVPRVTKSFKKF